MWLLLQSLATLTATLLLPWPRLTSVLLVLAMGSTLGLQLLTWFNFYRRFKEAAKVETASRRSWPALVLAAAFLLLAGLVPLFLVLPLQKVISMGGRLVPLADLFGLVWGGSGHYAVFSPVVLLFFGGAAYLFTKLIEMVAKGGDW